MRNSHKARLAELERRVAAANVQHEEDSEWSAEELRQRACWALVHNELQFDSPRHVVVRHCTPPLRDREFLQKLADAINEVLAQQPGAVLIPLMPDQAELGLRALDAGIIADDIGQTMRAACGPSSQSGICQLCGRSYLDFHCQGLDVPFDLQGLLYDLNAAIDLVNRQQPAEPVEHSADGLRGLLESIVPRR